MESESATSALRRSVLTLHRHAATRLDHMTPEEACGRRAVVEQAFEYARERAWLARGLQQHFTDSLTAERWSAWTRAEASVPDERLERFSDGGALCGSGEVRRGLISELVAAMSRDASAACVVPDPMGRPGDPFLWRTQAPYMVIEDGVYYVERERNPDRLSIAWDSAASAAGQMGLVTTASPDSAEPTHEQLLGAAARATLIVVEAYDGEGALFFARRPAL